MTKHDKYFELAKRLSLKSDHYQFKIGSVLVKKNRIISTGFNSLKTHPRSPHKYKSVHSEFMCVLGISAYDLAGATIYVYRETKDGNKAMAKPCKYCDRMLEQCGVKTVYYTVKEGIDSYEYY